MNSELKSYLRTQAIISAAFNLFINGMVAALIYHQADYVPTNVVSIAIDLAATCLFTFGISEPFIRSSLKQTKTAGILEAGNRLMRLTAKLFRLPGLFSVVVGLTVAIILAVLVGALFIALGVYALPFGIYIALKCAFATVLGAGVALLELYSGMCKVSSTHKA